MSELQDVQLEQMYQPFDRKQVASWMRAMPASFRDWLHAQKESIVTEMTAASDLHHVGRCQGALEFLTRIIQLREET